MKISRVSLAALAAATMLAGAVGSAKASSLFGAGGNITPNQTNVNQILYHNYENVFDSNGFRVSNTTPVIPGDYIVGILNIDQISPPGTTVGATFGTSGSPAGVGEVTGIFAQQVLATSTPTVLQLGTAGRSTFFDTLNGPTTTINTGLASNEMFGFYQDNGGAGGTPTNPFAATGTGVTLASSVASATNGNLLFTLGLAPNPAQGDPNTGYFYSNVNNPNPQSLAINGFGGLNFVQNLTGNTFNTIFDTSATTPTPVGFILESSITPNNTTPSPWDFASHDPADVSVFVPVPAAAWTGMMMLGALGGMAAIRRRKLAKA